MVKVIGRGRQYATLRALEQLSQPIRLSVLRWLPSRHDRRSSAVILSVRGHVDDRCSPPGPEGADASAPAKRRAAFTRGVVEAASSWTMGQPWRTSVRCIARVQPPCTGRIQVQLVTQHAIDWACSDSDEQGRITGYTGDASNLSRYRPQGPLVTWYVGETGWEYLRQETSGQPHLRAVLARASPSQEPQNLLVLRATAAERLALSCVDPKERSD
jgi:hypothetical protein